MKVLVTGGAGYIGSITNSILRSQGVETVVFDSLKNGHRASVGDTPFISGDLTIKSDIDEVFGKYKFDAVVHFAAMALAGESMDKPYEYYTNNILGGINLLEAMRRNDCNTLIFSSTCAVYGYPKHLPVTEEEHIAPESVYGSSKHMLEEIISWYGKIYGLKYANLRYFNAAGATLDGSLGEDHVQETHIIPILLSVAAGKKKHFDLFGKDYPTSDGTCVRDYIHVIDLVDAHIRAIDYLKKGGKSTSVNLGVGRGYSNLEVLAAVEKVTGKKIPYVTKSRRSGDPARIYANNEKAKKLLLWEPRHSDLETIISSAWKWHQTHPEGYENRD